MTSLPLLTHRSVEEAPDTAVLSAGWLRIVRSEAAPTVPAVCFLGYPLHLSPLELLALQALAEHFLVDPLAFVPTDALRAVCAHATPPEEYPLRGEDDPPLPPTPCSAQQIAVLVGRINKKAAAIGGRHLIEGRSHRGYRLNRYM